VVLNRWQEFLYIALSPSERRALDLDTTMGADLEVPGSGNSWTIVCPRPEYSDAGESACENSKAVCGQHLCLADHSLARKSQIKAKVLAKLSRLSAAKKAPREGDHSCLPICEAEERCFRVAARFRDDRRAVRRVI
jgi:hypothetical protein